LPNQEIGKWSNGQMEAGEGRGGAES
jgi:hypothetical protein